MNLFSVWGSFLNEGFICISSSISMHIPSFAAMVGIFVSFSISFASLFGPLKIICIPKWVIIAVSGFVSFRIFMASSVVMCPFHGFPVGLITQSMSSLVFW